MDGRVGDGRPGCVRTRLEGLHARFVPRALLPLCGPHLLDAHRHQVGELGEPILPEARQHPGEEDHFLLVAHTLQMGVRRRPGRHVGQPELLGVARLLPHLAQEVSAPE